MARTPFIAALATLTAVLTPCAARAHHSAAATYDADHTLDITGRVTGFSWRNPHSHLYVAVASGPFAGKVYTVELSSLVSLQQDGWTRTTLTPGDRVTLRVNPSRAGAPIGLCRGCPITANGKPLSSGLLQN